MVAMAILHRLILEGPVTMPEPYRTLERIFVIMLFASSGCVAVRHTKQGSRSHSFSVGGQSVRFDPRYAKPPRTIDPIFLPPVSDC
jgi:hypothetical protein